VVIDGFTVQGGTAGTPPGGICVAGADSYGAEVLNNIIQNNSNGICPISSSEVVVEHNLFRNNSVGTGSYIGYGIYASGTGTLGITDNEFTGNQAAAIYVSTCNFVVMTNNTSDKDGAFVIMLGTTNASFSHNQGMNFGAKPLLGVADAAVSIGYGNMGIEINDNNLLGGEGSISHGVAFTAAFGTSVDSEGVVVKDNSIMGFAGNGIVAEAGTGPTGMTRYSSIVGNQVRDNGLDGISIEAADVYNTNISLFDNVVEGNHVFDCQDASTAAPGYTLGTHNTWFNDTGNLSSPAGLCTPYKSH
jgi:parallel beta-helix repeat protein